MPARSASSSGVTLAVAKWSYRPSSRPRLIVIASRAASPVSKMRSAYAPISASRSGEESVTVTLCPPRVGCHREGATSGVALRDRRLGRPVDGPLWFVHTKCPGSHGVLEMSSEIGVLALDAADRQPDPAGHCLAGPLRGTRRVT